MCSAVWKFEKKVVELNVLSGKGDGNDEKKQNGDNDTMRESLKRHRQCRINFLVK